MKLEIKDVLGLTVVVTLMLFFTGIAVVPFTNGLTKDPYTQNIMYAIGRLPVVFTVIYFYLTLLGDKE